MKIAVIGVVSHIGLIHALVAAEKRDCEVAILERLPPFSEETTVWDIDVSQVELDSLKSVGTSIVELGSAVKQIEGDFRDLAESVNRMDKIAIAKLVEVRNCEHDYGFGSVILREYNNPHQKQEYEQRSRQLDKNSRSRAKLHSDRNHCRPRGNLAYSGRQKN